MMSDTNGFEENSKSPSIKYLPVGTKFTVFEFPALIESPTNAVNALSTNSNGFLLDLSNGQDQSKNLLVLGDKLTFNGLVAEFGTSPRIIGGVSETVNFRKPVDFCSLSKIEKKASSMDIDLITSEVEKACSSKLELELPKFESLQPNHQYTSRNYILPVHSKDLFESCIIANPLLFLSPNLIEDDANALSEQRNNGRPLHQLWMMSFLDTQIPVCPLPELLEQHVSNTSKQVILDKLNQLFSQQAIWRFPSIQSHFPEIGAPEIRLLMPLVAFYFIDGPWRHTWVRYGFDPRMEINRDISYLFQTIEIRSHTVAKITSKLSPELFHAPNEFLKDLSNKAVDSQIPVGFDGIHLSSIQGQLQLADISYAPIQSLVTRSLVSVCQKRDGWLVKGSISRIRAMIIDRWMNIISEIDPKLLDLDGSVLQIKRGDPVDVWRPDGDGGERTSRQSYINLKNEDLMDLEDDDGYILYSE